MRPDLVDVAVSAIALSLSLSTAAFVASEHGEPSLSGAAIGVQAASAAVLLWRRLLPVPVWFAVGALASLYGLLNWPDPLLPFVPMLALVAVFEWARPRMRAAVLIATMVIAVVGTAAVGDSSGLDWWTTAFVVLGAPLAGAYLRTRRELIAELRAHAGVLEQRRREEIDVARRSERLRVARDLHDVVAHHVTLAVVQAEATAATRSDEPTRAALDSIARSGRNALTDLRHMIGALRDGAVDDAPLAPAPTLGRIEQLVDGVRSNGFEIELVDTGSSPPLDAVVDTAAYRVVQESLTNVVKHAGDRRARVRIDRRDGSVTVDVENALDHSGSVVAGAGIVGLRERVALAGGTISVGPTADGTFQVHATFPVGSP
jgi:signal transduction histidine kinase